MHGRNAIMQARGLCGAICLWAMTVGFSSCSQQQFGIVNQSQTFSEKITYSKSVDILWVVDTSGSMSEHQTLLAGQVDSFISALNSTGLDYHIGVTTMDMGSGGEKGRLLAKSGTPSVLRPGTPQLTSVLAERLRAGEIGSPVERGREAMKTALQSSVNGTANVGFLRQDALLVVIFLTNEADESASIDYAAFLDGIKPKLATGERSWVAHFMGVVPGDPNCKSSKWDYSSPGVEYIELAERSGGVVESICDADLRRALTNVKSRILEVATEYPLDRVPNLSTIKVYLNGKKIENDPVNGWTYEESTNSIRFHGTSIPGPASSIKVDFDPRSLG